MVAGGGVALLRCQGALDSLEAASGEQGAGVRVLRRALEEPLRWIAQNAGVDGPVVVARVRAREGGFGYNARTERYEDLVEAGVIDPAKVVRVALQNAASVAGLMRPSGDRKRRSVFSMGRCGARCARGRPRRAPDHSPRPAPCPATGRVTTKVAPGPPRRSTPASPPSSRASRLTMVSPSSHRSQLNL